MAAVAPVVAAVATVAGAGASVYSGIQQNKAQREAAKQAERNEDLVQEQAAREAEIRVDQANRDVARQRASLASRGILTSSTAATLRRFTKRYGEEDASAIRRSGEIESSNFGAEASARRASGNAAMVGGIGSGVQQAASGALDIAEYWRR